MPPLSILRLRLGDRCGSFAEGLTCSGTSSHETHDADAARRLQSVPILWYRKVREKKNNINVEQQQMMVLSPHQWIKIKREIKTPESPQSIIEAVDNEAKKEEDGHGLSSEPFYIRIKAVLSVCDTQSGPALEIKASGLDLSQIMRKYDIIDEFPDYDVISSFTMNVMHSDNDQYFVERIIPLSMIDHTAPGKHYDFVNLIHSSGGICNCDVKVYGSE